MKNPKQQRYYIDTMDNLIRWDTFHVINENLMKKYHLDKDDNKEGAVLEACDLYVLHTEKCTTNPGNRLLYCVADPKSEDPSRILTMKMSVHPKEPVYVRRRKNYNEGTVAMIHLLDAKKRLATNEEGKKNIEFLIKQVAGIMARENGFQIEDKKDDGKDDTN